MSQEDILHRKSQSETSKQSLFENRFYCKKEVSNILRLSIKTIDVMMKADEIKFLKLGRAVRFNGIYLNEKFGL